jgi:hypothetical protein
VAELLTHHPSYSHAVFFFYIPALRFQFTPAT